MTREYEKKNMTPKGGKNNKNKNIKSVYTQEGSARRAVNDHDSTKAELYYIVAPGIVPVTAAIITSITISLPSPG